CISVKTTGLDRLRESRAQILWGMYNKKNVDYYEALIPDDMINKDVRDSKAYKTYYDFATGKATPKKARKLKKVASPSRKLFPVLEEKPSKKLKRAKKPVKKSTTVPTTVVAIKYTPRTGTKVGVPDIPKYLSESENESWGDSDDDDSDEVTKDDDKDDVESDADDDKEASDSEKTDSDEDENLNLNQNDDEEK
nr:hypothetical protein [Tanacetum cinerariifolium]